jgi:uncharacterized membrane protein YbhN (UPF0104 family)
LPPPQEGQLTSAAPIGLQLDPAITDGLEPATAHGLEPAGIAATRPTIRGWCARRRWVIAAALAVLVAAAGVSAATIDSVSDTDLLGVLRLLVENAVRLRWQFVAVVLVLAALHYVATAIAARAASGLALPMREVVLVQLAAAAANRITPAGVGGSALTARYFKRRGLDLAGAVGAVTTLAVLNAVASTLALSTLVLLASVFGLHGSSHEVHQLVAHVTGLLGPARSPWLWLAVPVLVGAIAAGAIVVRRRAHQALPWSHLLEPIRNLFAHPRRLATLLAASGCTTLVLGLAFVATTSMVPGAAPSVGIGALLLGFMLGSVAGSAVPVPAGLGSSEAAYVAVLLSVQVPASQAVEEVLIFRLLTFWLPAAVGVLATGYLRRRRAI